MKSIIKSIFYFLFFKVFKLDFFFLHKNQRFSFLIEQSQFINNAKSGDIEEAIKYMVPVGSSKPLIRIGGDSDGAYLLPDDLDGIDACFSPGTSYTTKFEDELARDYKIKSFLSDASVEEKSLNLLKEYHFFQKKWINDFNDKNTTTLSSWINSANLSKSKNLILQMDIEGAEYNTLLNTSRSCLSQFRILLIEFHQLNRLKNERFLNQIFTPIMERILSQFDCVHAHANNCKPSVKLSKFYIPPVIELTFYRKDCNQGEKKKFIPHPLDIINVDNKPPLLLGKPWI